AEHFTLSAFAVFIDHLRLAADEGDRSRPLHVQWSIMSCRHDPIRASCGVALQPTSSPLPPASLDYVVVVGGILHAGPQIDEATVRYLREVGATHTPLIGICTGSFVLCRAGLMEGRRSCVNWYHYQDFREAFPAHDVVADRLFLADGPRITCAGGARDPPHRAAPRSGAGAESHAGAVVRPAAPGERRSAPSTAVGGHQRATRAPGTAADGAEPDTADLDRHHFRRARRLDAAARAPLPRECRHGAGLPLSPAAHALCELADSEHGPLDDRHRHRDRIRRLRTLLAAVQGRLDRKSVV